jgi:hypothetical protein
MKETRMKVTKNDTEQHLLIAKTIIDAWGDSYSVNYALKDGIQTITFSSGTANSVPAKTAPSAPIVAAAKASALDEAISAIREKIGSPVDAPAPVVEAPASPADSAIASIRAKFGTTPSPMPAKKTGKTKSETLSDDAIPVGTVLGGVYKGTVKLVKKNECGYMDPSGFGPVYKTISGAAKALCGGKPINGFRFFRLNWEGYKRADDLTRVADDAHATRLAQVWEDFAPLEVLSADELEAKLAEIKTKKAAARAAKKAAKA